MSDDAYAVTSGAYDLFAGPARAVQLAALDEVLTLLRPEAGPILDIGAGSGALTVALLERLPSARVLAIEPSFAMRALALSRLAAHPVWFERVTVRPEDFFATALPDRIGGALLLGVLGHFDPGERAAVLAELATRLPGGGAALLDLQAPERPCRVEAYEFTVARIGAITYRGIAEAWPRGEELMRWRMTYLSLEGERVLTEDTHEFLFRHPAPSTVAAEAAQVGLALDPIGDDLHWILHRP